MERASVTRLYNDRQSKEAILLLEGTTTKHKFRITVPEHRASVLALEGHGLNDRCTLYGMLSECVSRLGGSFGSVVVNLDSARGVSGVMALMKDGDVSHIRADAIELVAFALHVQLPIYVDPRDAPDVADSFSCAQETGLPEVFERALTDIFDSGHDSSSSITEPVDQEPRRGRDSGQEADGSTDDGLSPA